MNAQILADSLNTHTGDRLTTFVLPRFPKPLLAQLNTHRQLSRNAASKRAIPLSRVMDMIQEDPYIPSFTASQRGMGGELITNPNILCHLKIVVEDAIMQAAMTARALYDSGCSKEVCNLYLEPFMRVPVIVSGTEWENFFALRCKAGAGGAMTDFAVVAQEMKNLYEANSPTELDPGEWHMPYVKTAYPIRDSDEDTYESLADSVASCARVSYSNHGGEYSHEKNVGTFKALAANKHMSPFEHPAVATYGGKYANFQGFKQARTMVEEGKVLL